MHPTARLAFPGSRTLLDRNVVERTRASFVGRRLSIAKSEALLTILVHDALVHGGLCARCSCELPLIDLVSAEESLMPSGSSCLLRHGPLFLPVFFHHPPFAVRTGLWLG